MRPKPAGWTSCVLITAIAAAGLLSAARALADPILGMNALSRACVGQACSAFDFFVGNAEYGLTFTGAESLYIPFDPDGTTTFALATLSRARVNVSSDQDPLPLTLQLSLTSPAAIAPLFTGSVLATTPGGGGPLLVDFDNSWHRLTTQAGTFELAILEDARLPKKGFATVMASIRAVSDAPVSVPEPSTLMLLGVGLAGVVWRIRQRR
jgi:PEP-CTERM motif